MSHRLTDRLRGRTLLLFTALTLVAVAGCGKGDTAPTPPGSSTYTGTVTGPTINGTLTVTIGTANPEPGLSLDTRFNATGTFTPAGGAAVALSGSYYDTGGFDHMYILGGDAPGPKRWEFTGTLTSFGGFRGTGSDTLEFIDPNDADEVAFTTLLKGGTTDVTVVIGSTTGSIPANFNFAILGSEVRGDAVTAIGLQTPLDGTIASGNISIVQGISAPPQTLPPIHGPTPAIGTYTAPNALGTYDDGASNTGTWAGVKTP